MLIPSDSDTLLAMVAENDRISVVGARTKPRLCRHAHTLISMTGLRGITEYAPSEYTVTVLAGTPMTEVVETLKASGQYLPFDPMLEGSGATVGGTVAAGFSGPRRFRYGGLRDFLLGVRFISGEGKLLTAGGKVVKNAAGFDFPKLLIGSQGTLGILTELTFKVFPEPETSRTLRVACPSHQVAVERMTQAAVSRWELDSLDYRSSSRHLYLRVQGTERAVVTLGQEMASAWADAAESFSHDQAASTWQDVRECRWTGGRDAWVKVPLTLKSMPALAERLDAEPEIDAHVSAGGAVAWLASESAASTTRLDEILRELGLAGLCFRGETETHWLGSPLDRSVFKLVKQALDPSNRYPDLQD